jgi:hypothetical protein
MKQGTGRYTGRMLLVVSTAAFLVYIFGQAFGLWWHLIFKVFGTAVPPSDTPEGIASWKDAWELTFYITQLGVLVAAVVGGFLAYRQLREAQDARLANIYLEIQDRWKSPDVVESRRLIAGLAKEFRERVAREGHCRDADGTVLGSPAALIQARLQKLLETDPKAFSKHMVYLTILEDIGAMCRKGYIEAQDISDLMGSSIVQGTEFLLLHIRQERRGANSKSIWANALWLYRSVKRDHAPYIFEEQD